MFPSGGTTAVATWGRMYWHIVLQPIQGSRDIGGSAPLPVLALRDMQVYNKPEKPYKMGEIGLQQAKRDTFKSEEGGTITSVL